MKDIIKNIVSKINMKWLFFIIPITIILILIIVSSIFTVEEDKKNKEEKIKDVIFTTKDNRVDFKTTTKYNFKNSDVSDYDLYIKDDKNQLTMAIFAYDLSTLEENSAKEILNNQISYFLKTRNDMKIFKEESTKKFEDKTITTIEYSGKSEDTSKCIYRFSSIEFTGDLNYVLYITQVIIKDDYEDNIKGMQDIIESAKLK